MQPWRPTLDMRSIDGRHARSKRATCSFKGSRPSWAVRSTFDAPNLGERRTLIARSEPHGPCDRTHDSRHERHRTEAQGALGLTPIMSSLSRLRATAIW